MEASHNGIPPGGLAATKAEVQTAENNAKAYADGLVVGLLDDRGDYDASVNTFPAAGGSGAAGAVLKGDVWMISVAGTLGGVAVEAGDVIRALIDTPGQTAGNWTITERNLGYVPENPANKDASGGYAGLTLFKLNLRNAANTFTSFLTNAATAARTWTMQDRDGTVAFTTGSTASLASSAGVVTIDCAANTDSYALALTENITSWVFNNPPAAGTFRDIQVRITQHASAAKTVVSPATAGRTAGGVWVQSATLSSVEQLAIRVSNDGTRDLFPSGVYA